MSKHSPENDAGLYDRIQAVIDWFEKVPAKAKTYDGTLVGHYVEASDWRAIRSELNQIANATRPIPPGTGDSDA